MGYRIIIIYGMNNLAENNFECKRCGKCCEEHGYLTSLVDKKEWLAIAQHIEEKHDGIIMVNCNCGCDEQTEVTPEDIINDVELTFKDYINSHSFLAFDHADCPFLIYDKKNKIYSCEIQHIKPKKCSEYRCDVHGR